MTETSGTSDELAAPESEPKSLTLHEVQRAAWANKVAKGFNTEDVPLELAFIQRELAEFFAAWRFGEGSTGSELADVVIFVAGLAEMVGDDLGAEVAAKLETNAARTYRTLPNGGRVKVQGAVAQS